MKKINFREIKARKQREGNKGFTLVEIIVVLVILAILMAALVPSLIGFVNEAKAKTNITLVRQIYTAAQSAVTEQCSINPDFAVSAASLRNADGERCGRITNYALYHVQNNRSMASVGDAAIARKILKYIDSETKSSAQFRFDHAYNPQGMTVEAYMETYKQPGINICYLENGTVQFVEFGWDGYLIHFENAQTTVTKNGTFSEYPK